jgi:hypothetical protein
MVVNCLMLGSHPTNETKNTPFLLPNVARSRSILKIRMELLCSRSSPTKHHLNKITCKGIFIKKAINNICVPIMLDVGHKYISQNEA